MSALAGALSADVSELPRASGGVVAACRWQPPAPVDAEALALARAVAEAGGQALVVGGWVRDALLGGAPRDVDLEVFGLDPGALAQAAGRRSHSVGADFGILKVGAIDVSFPRGARRPGVGAAGLAEDVDPHLSLAEAARRRDFTVNALAWDPLSGALYDPTGGLGDLRARVLRRADPLTLGEDPVRALRACQLAGRLALTVEAETLALLPGLVAGLAACPGERLFKELTALLLRAQHPRVGWRLARDIGAVGALWPELEALPAAIWEETVAALGWLARDPSQRADELALRLAVLGHGLAEGAFQGLLERITRERALIIGAPLIHRGWRGALSLAAAPPSDAQVRILSTRVTLGAALKAAEAIDRGRAEARGEPGLAASGALAALRRQAEALGVLEEAPAPWVRGRDLIRAGIPAGPALGVTLDAVYRAQLEGRIRDAAAGIALARALSEEG